MEKRIIVINQDTGVIENIINADDSFELPDKILIEHDEAGFDWSYEGGELIPPVIPDPVPQPFEPSELQVRLAALEEKAGITQADKDAARTALKDSA